VEGDVQRYHVHGTGPLCVAHSAVLGVIKALKRLGGPVRMKRVVSVLVARDGAGTRGAGFGRCVLTVFGKGGLREVAGGDAGQGL